MFVCQHSSLSDSLFAVYTSWQHVCSHLTFTLHFYSVAVSLFSYILFIIQYVFITYWLLKGQFGFVTSGHCTQLACLLTHTKTQDNVTYKLYYLTLTMTFTWNIKTFIIYIEISKENTYYFVDRRNMSICCFLQFFIIFRKLSYLYLFPEIAFILVYSKTLSISFLVSVVHLRIRPMYELSLWWISIIISLGTDIPACVFTSSSFVPLPIATSFFRVVHVPVYYFNLSALSLTSIEWSHQGRHHERWRNGLSLIHI